MHVHLFNLMIFFFHGHLEKRPSAPKTSRQSQRTCLPSDTEEEEDEESDNDQAKDDETDDGSEVFQGNITAQMTQHLEGYVS